MVGGVSHAYLFHAFNGNYLFTMNDSLKTINIFIIRSCIDKMSRQEEILKVPNYPKISNFRMAKKCTITLDYKPQCIDNYADYFLVSYKEPIPFIDIYEKSGCFYQRLNVQAALNAHSLRLARIKKILFPRMRWSDRKIEEFERQNRLQLLKKFLIIGDCKERNDEQIEEGIDRELVD